jgi:Domain of unknown function (DUF397)
VNWRKSSYSNSQGACVEVAGFADQMAVRDSKDRGGPLLSFDRRDWSAFLANLSR